MISSCEHHTKHTDCLRQFLIFCGRDFDSSSLAAFKQLDKEAAEKGFCPLVELRNRIAEDDDDNNKFVKKTAFDCSNSLQFPSSCPIHGVEGEVHCSCIEKFIAEKQETLTPGQIFKVRQWMRTSADPRSCALWQLCQLHQEELDMHLDEETFCECDCEGNAKSEAKNKKKEKKEKKEKKQLKEKAKKQEKKEKKAKKKKKQIEQSSSDFEFEHIRDSSLDSTTASNLMQLAVMQSHPPALEVEQLLEVEVGVVAKSQCGAETIVAKVMEEAFPALFESVPIEAAKEGIQIRRPSGQTSYAKSWTALPLQHQAVNIETDFGIANQSDPGDSVLVIPSPAADFATPSLGESREKVSNQPPPTINTAPLADAESNAVPANAVIDYAFNDPDAGSVITEKKTSARKIVAKVEEVEEEEDGEAEVEPGKEKDAVFAITPSVKDIQVPVAKVQSTYEAEELNGDSKTVLCQKSSCGPECDCANGRCLLMRRMERILKRFIVSLRNKDKNDFKKYYKTVMQNLDATFETKTFVELNLEEIVFLLSCDDLSVDTEDRIFDMLIHWIAYDVARRKVHILELLKCVRLVHVKKSEVTRMLENVIVAQDLTTRRHALLQGALAFKEYSRENQINYIKAFKDYFMIPKKRGKKDSVSVVETMNALLDGKLCQCVPDTKSKFPLTVNITHPFLFLTSDGCTVSSQVHLDSRVEAGENHCVSFPDLNVKEEVIAIIGGRCHDYPYGRDAGFHVFFLNPFSLTWDVLTRLPAPRHHHGVAYVNGILYVIGGVDKDKAKARGNGVSKDVFAFDPVGDTWWACPPLSTPRSHHSVNVAFGLIYVCGGLDDEDRVLDSVEVFNPETCVWAVGDSMAIGRAAHACSLHNDAIWVLGGFGNAKKKREQRQALRSVEVYDIKSNRWRVGPPLRYARCHGVSVSVCDRLHLVGGAAWTLQAGRSDVAMTTTSDMDVLNEELQSWYQIGNLAVKRQEFGFLCQGHQMRIFGGLSSDENRTTQSCEIVNLKRATSTPWGPAIPIPVAGAKSVKLSVPLHRLERKGLPSK